MKIQHTTKKRNKKKNFDGYLIVAFLLPFLIMTGILALQGIWWKSATTILASDSFHQYVIFHQVLRNSLHGDGSLFYTFTSGLGLNFYALSSYYLGSFLAPLAYFFDLQSIPDFIYLATIVKFGLTGLSSYISLKGIYKQLAPPLLVSLSTSFSLMSFTTSQLEITSWLDVFILLPLILLGLHKVMTGQGRLLYYCSLSLLFLQNYYFGYMTALFLILWSLALLSWNIKERIRYLLDFTVVSILATLTSMVMLLPTVLDLKTHGEKLTSILQIKTENSWYFDMFAKYLTGSFDTTKFGSIPMIYVGLLPLLLTLLFFTIKEIKLVTKLTYALVLLTILASFYLEPINLFWQGMHAPNMFLYRYAWTFSTVLIYMGAETLSRLNRVKLPTIYLTSSILGSGFLLTYFFKDHYDFLDTIHFFLTFEFLVVYLLLLFVGQKKKLPTVILSFSVLAFISLELAIHTHYQVKGVADEWHFPSRKNYEEKLTDIDTLVKYAQGQEDAFFRMERLLPQTGNDSMKFNYNGISQFSSIRNRSSSSTLDKLGFRSDGTNLNLRYQNNTLIADSLFGVRYNLATSDPLKFGFTLTKRQEKMNLYQNQFSLDLAILTDGVYKDINFSNLTLDNQEHFLNQITGLKENYYSPLPILSSENATEFSKRVTVNKIDSTHHAIVNYQIDVPKYSQVYINLPKLTFSNDKSKKVVLTVNNQSTEFTIDNAFSFFNAGYYLDDQIIQLSISFPENDQVSFDPPQFFRLDLTAFEKATRLLKEKEVRVHTKGNTIQASYQTDKESSLLFTIPYDKGWTAKLNGHSLPLEKAQGGFIKARVPSGEGEIVLTFVPNGFLAGALLSLTGILLFCFYDFHRKRRFQSSHKNNKLPG